MCFLAVFCIFKYIYTVFKDTLSYFNIFKTPLPLVILMADFLVFFS